MGLEMCVMQNDCAAHTTSIGVPGCYNKDVSHVHCFCSEKFIDVVNPLMVTQATVHLHCNAQA